ncbi:MAG TPA: amino acid ABC transporter permease, partial [Magnetovibrio sp.]
FFIIIVCQRDNRFMTDQTSTSRQQATSKTSPWNDPTYRAITFQLLAAIGIVWFFWTIFDNTLTNMENRGITTGFGFLDNTAGFGILFSLVEYTESHTYGRTFIVGLLNTLLVSGVGIVFATIIGFIVGVARLSPNWLLRKMATVYVESLRNVPLLLQIFFWNFAVIQPLLPSPRQSFSFADQFFLNKRGFYLPKPHFDDSIWLVVIAFFVAIAAVVYIAKWARRRQEATGQPFHTFWTGLGVLIGLPLLVYFVGGVGVVMDYPALKGFNFQGGTEIIPELLSLALALSMYTAAFIAEIVRAGIQGVSHGQTEAARALGLRHGPTLRLIVIPQAMRIIIPPLTSQYLNLVKNSSLATAIGYPDLVSVFMGTTLNQTGQAVEIVAMTMGVYLTISLAISAFMNWWNAKMALVER